MHLNKPDFKPDFVPPQYLCDTLKISHFFQKFDDFIEGPEFSAEELYVCIMYDGEDRIDLIHDIHIALLWIFLDEFDNNNQYEQPSNNGTLFYLLKNVQDGFVEHHIRIFWPELYMALTQTPDFEDIFPENIISIVKEICELGVDKYNSLEPAKKYQALSFLMEAIYELSSFRGHLQGLIERQLEKAREKSKILEKMKNEEVELRCLEEKNNQLKTEAKNHEEIKRQLSRVEGLKKDQEILNWSQGSAKFLKLNFINLIK